MKSILNDFSINVTEMFRDLRFFLLFRKNIVPFLRCCPYICIWHAGSSAGEEVVSMAILLHEEGLHEKTRIFATNKNENAINIGKRSEFSLKNMQLYTKNYLSDGGKRAFSEYYSAENENATFHSFLTKNVVFAQHNLATDHSFIELHVIICRNVMIYFNKTLQNRVLNLLHESLYLSGILGLGSKEGIKFTSIAKYYKEVDTFEKLYRKFQ